MVKLLIYLCLKTVFWIGLISGDVNFLRAGYVVQTWYLRFFSSLWKDRSRGWDVPSILDTPILRLIYSDITVSLHRSQRDPQGMDQTPDLRSWNKTPVSSILKFVLNQVLLSIPYIRVQVYREVLHCFSSNSTTGGPNLFWMSCEDNSPLQCLPLTTTGQVGHPTAKATTWYRSSSSRGGQSKCIWVCTQCPQKTLSGLIS